MTDNEILAALRAGKRELAWNYMYKNWRHKWIFVIKKLGGTEEEAHSAMSEAVESFEKAVTKPEFKLNDASLSTYLTNWICNQWKWYTAKKMRPLKMTPVEEKHFRQEPNHTIEDIMMTKECEELLDQVLTSIGERCRKILKLYGERTSMKEIAEIMGFQGGSDTAKNEKHKCIKKLENYVQNKPDLYHSLINCIPHG